jgi:16S rRNA (guanine1207-N2)-methyltransferase
MSASPGDDGPLRLMIECVAALGALRHPLVVGESSGALTSVLRAAGAEPRIWLRQATESTDIAPLPWPDGDSIDGAIIRLPKSKDSLMLALHATAAKVPPNGVIAVFGANAEGARSIAPRLADVADGVETLGTGHHARVLIGRRKTSIDGLRSRLKDWRHEGRIEIAGSARLWVSYPGTFAKGGLDAGSAYLIAHLPALPKDVRVLDYAAGTGVLAAALWAKGTDLAIDMIEADALALTAACENVPTARGICAASLAAVKGQRYDLIVSNPPIHDGISESRYVLERLITEAPAHLCPSGTLLLVVQRRVTVLPLLQKAFGTARIVADNGRFTVASAERAARGR